MAGLDENALFVAASAVAEQQGIELKRPRKLDDALPHEDIVQAIAAASAVRVRLIKLPHRWWAKDLGPVLGFLEVAGVLRPIALLKAGAQVYAANDPVTGGVVKVGAAIASKIPLYAYTFFRPLPKYDSEVKRFFFAMLKDSQSDLRRFRIVSFGMSLLALVPPLLLSQLVDWIIPFDEYNFLWHFSAAFILASAAIVFFEVVQNFLLGRIAARFQSTSQAALIDRLIQLPLHFFRVHPAAELSFRALGFENMRLAVSDAGLRAAINGVFGCTSLFFVFLFSRRIGLIASAFIFLQLLWLSVMYWQLHFLQRRFSNEQIQASNGIYEALSSLAKIKTAAIEGVLYRRWSNAFAKLLSTALMIIRKRAVIHIASNVFEVMLLFALFIFTFQMQESELSSGQFVAVYYALITFSWALFRFGEAVPELMQVLPAYESMRPILHTEPEYSAEQSDPGVLSGKIEASRLSFHYPERSKFVLSDVNLSISPGEFIGIVGGSGAGKSSLLRLLLGFERPVQGMVLYDDQDLKTLNLVLVRKQFGVVLQNGKLFPGSILDNIVGSSLLGVDDALEAARLAGLSSDIEEMPMGIHTLIGEGSGMISGGQKQRILIARALVKKPRILFFDEATSSLDNQSQQHVSNSLAALQVTRIVVAHRLTTIRDANRIYVMDEGRIVQAGGYEELMTQAGIFRELSKRQIT